MTSDIKRWIVTTTTTKADPFTGAYAIINGEVRWVIAANHPGEINYVVSVVPCDD